jgi:hypothetical protein
VDYHRSFQVDYSELHRTKVNDDIRILWVENFEMMS